MLGLALALALVATACHSTPSTFKVGENDVNPVAAGTLQDGGTLNWPIASLPINYNFNSGADTDVLSIVSALMPTLFTFDALAQPVRNPDYLTSADVTGSNPQVVTYEINPKATWGNGTPITEGDFQTQWQALNGSNTVYRTPFTQTYGQISSVTQGKDAREVVVTFAHPFADWRGLFSPLYPAFLNKDPQTFNDGWTTGTVTSAGPFVFQGYDNGAKTVTLLRNPSWWGTAPRLYSIVFHAVGSDPNGQLDAMSKGQVDFVGLAPDATQLARAKGMNGTVVRRAAGPTFRQLTFNGTSPTLSDPKIREAIGLAVDRAAIAKALLDPLGAPDTALDNHIFMANQHGYRRNAGEFSTPDTAKAGMLLDQAGWKLSGSSPGSSPGASPGSGPAARTKNGQPLTVRLVIQQGSSEATQEASLLTNQLQAVGVSLQVQSQPSQTFFNNFVQSGDFDLALFSWQGTVFPITSNLPIYEDPSTAPNGSLIVRENYARVGSANIDSLLMQASQELDQQKAIDLGNQADAAIWQEIHSLPLYQRPQLVVERSTLANFGAFGFATTNYETIGFTK